MDRVLIAGASGFIGTHLTRRLVHQGYRPICLDIAPPRERLAGADYLFADVRDLSQVQVGPIQTIWNLAAVHTTPGHADGDYYDTNINGALEITRLADRAGTREIVFTSSISVYGPSEDRKTEHSRPAPASPYGKSKLIAEAIHQSWQRSGPERKLVTVRPAVVFGQGEGGNFARLAALLRRGFFVFPGRRDTIKSCIYVEDLIDAILTARLGDEAAVLLNGAYPECPTLEQIVMTIGSKYFPGAKLIDLPRGVVMSAARAIGVLNGVGGIHPDRVTKLVRSTHVYPQWLAERAMLPAGSFTAGVDRWAEATRRSFV